MSSSFPNPRLDKLMYLRLTILHMILIITCLFQPEAFAMKFPDLRRHSETLIQAYQGDRVLLRAEMGPGPSKLVWYTRTGKACDGSSCEIDTSRWNPGLHRVYLIVGNEAGARSVTFNIQLFARTADRSPTRIVVPMTDFGRQVRQPTASEPYIVALQGQGFSYRTDSPHRAESKLDVIGRAARRLDWNESLRSSVAWVKFGMLGSDEHFLAPGAQARLLTVADQSNRLILLENGKLRSRFLSPGKAVPVTVIVSNWLQIDGYPGADFYIDYDATGKSGLNIHVLRGGVELKLRDPLEVPDVFGELRDHEIKEEQRRQIQRRQSLTHTVAAGQSIQVFEQANRPPVYGLLDGKLISQILQASSPHLWSLNLQDTKIAEDKFLITGRLFDQDSKLMPAELLQRAKSDIKKSDYLLALDRLTQFDGIARSYEALLIAGQSFMELGVTDRARNYLEAAYAIQNDDPNLHMLLALSYLNEENWDQAKTWLQRAEQHDAADSDLISYYLGVIAYTESAWRRSSRYFQDVARLSRDSELQLSSREFLVVLEEKRKFWAELGLAIVYDSHIFGTNNDRLVQSVDPELELASPGIVIQGQVKRRFSFGQSFDLAVWGRFIRRDWQIAANSEAARLEESIGLETRYGRKKRFSLEVELETILIGPRRALDGGGLKAGYRFSESFGRPTLNIGYHLYRDPLPGYADLIDPLAERWQGVSSDRSSRVQYLNLNLGSDFGSRFQYRANTLVWNRLMDDSLARSLAERRYQQLVELGWRFHPSWVAFLDLGITKRLFSDGDLDRTDSVVRTGLGMNWQIHDHWFWTNRLLRKSHSSERSDFDFDQILAESGVVYRF